MKVGFFETAAAVVAQAKKQKIKLKDEIKWSAAEYKKKLERISKVLEVTKEQTASPAFQWAQSSEWLLLDVKFTHRFDAPGCLDVRSLRVNITESRFSLSATCLMSGEQIKYSLEFDFFQSVFSDKSGYKNTSSGRITVNIRKKEKGDWKLPMKGKKPQNLQTWFEMSEKTQGEMDKFRAENDPKAKKQSEQAKTEL